MKRTFPLLFLTILITLACSFPGVLAATQTAAPANVGPSVQPSGNTGSPVDLTGATWTWIGFTSPDEQVAVESPASYSLVFQQDGSVTITADCNTGQGSYQVHGQNLQIQAGALTRSACPPGSRSDQFLQYLGNASTYSMSDGNLYIDLVGDGGTLVFTPAGTQLPGSGKGAFQQALQANPWQWDGFASAAGQYDLESPGNYLLTFQEDGTVEIKADCNTGSGTYTLDNIKISIQIGPMTEVTCPAGSRSDEFLRYVGSAAFYFYQPGELYLNLGAESGTMRFIPVAPGS